MIEQESGLLNLVVLTNQWWPHVSTSLQIAAKALQRGQRVAILDLPRFIDVGFGQMWPPCAVQSRQARCIDQVLRRMDQEFPGGVKILRWPNEEQTQSTSDVSLAGLRACTSIEEIKQLQYRGRNIGYSIMSTIFSDCGHTSVSLAQALEMARPLIELHVALNNWARSMITTLDVNRVVVFNGRFAVDRPLVTAADELEIDLLYHEALADGRYTVIGGSVHSQTLIRDEVDRAWSAADDALRRSLARRWFAKRFSLDDLNIRRWSSTWESDSEVLDSLPSNLFVVFPSSDDEFSSVSAEYDIADGSSQLDRTRRACQVAQRCGMNALVRLHPNMNSKSRTMKKSWLNLRREGIQVLPPESNVNTYSLISRASVVASCGSTVGIEAAYLGKASVLLTPAFYSKLGICSEAMTDDDLRDLLVSRRFLGTEFARINAMKFAFFDAVRWLDVDENFVLPGFESPTMTFKDVVGVVWRRYRKFRRVNSRWLRLLIPNTSLRERRARRMKTRSLRS